MKNTSGTTCTMNGYPGVSLVDAGGHQIGPSATPETDQGPVAVTLAPGEFTSIVLHTNTGAVLQEGETCGTTSAGVKISPPGDTAAFTVTLGLEICGSMFTTTAVGTTS